MTKKREKLILINLALLIIILSSIILLMEVKSFMKKDEVVVKTQFNDPYKNLSDEDKIRLEKIVAEYKDVR